MPRAAGGVFLSYRRQDKHVAGRLDDRLVQRFGRERVFLDVENITPGTDFVTAITTAVSRCDVLIAVIGPQWLAATDARGRRRLDDPHDFVVLEITTALERRIRVIPVLVDDARMPAPEDLPESLRELSRRQAVEVEHSSFHLDLERILQAVADVLEPRPPAGHPPSGPQAHGRPRPAAPAPGAFPTDGIGRGDPVGFQAAAGRAPVVESPTEAMAAVPEGRRPGPRAPAAGARGAGIPPIRVVARTGLWWLIHVLSIPGAMLLATPVRMPSWSNAAIGLVLAGLLAVAIRGAANVLRREIGRQRAMLGVGPTAPAPRPLRTTWIRGVSAACATVAVGMAVAYALTPVLPT
ncbi:toll/interleukin-1 receptor domain-containing protein [Pseudonocardia humida]|uniref:Toll/interleukin-1 receptor domain-containing protein n=1 Tax=Pseudonocardia humida TaxID=2800819 RepID=A0ABT0ZSD3_9PSEU|nr:toll/interleukin-1 receptor domain-containing protein [Pseudonocardia humida]MCO1653635.1 toll/interleukin-1 receptor domain-containing protein [Pseudonocardia humida]